MYEQRIREILKLVKRKYHGPGVVEQAFIPMAWEERQADLCAFEPDLHSEFQGYTEETVSKRATQRMLVILGLGS